MNTNDQSGPDSKPGFIHRILAKFKSGDRAPNAEALEASSNGPLLHEVSASPNQDLDIIFVHGLHGHFRDTWKSGDSFWPEWIAEEFPRFKVWTLQWPAKAFSWRKAVDPFQYITNNALHHLVSKGIGERPIVFITHSMGGILVKSLLNVAATHGNKDWESIANRTKGIDFIATPNKGSSIATLGRVLNGYCGTVHVIQLEEDDPHLIQLNQWFQNKAGVLGYGGHAYYEQESTYGVHIVNFDSSNPGAPGYFPIQAPGNHFDICKFSGRENPIFLGIRRMLTQYSAARRWSAKVQSFRDEYTHKDDQQRFHGRDTELANLNDWLANEYKSRLLIAAPMGRGKSALLVRWTSNLDNRQETGAWRVIFVPVSMRFHTNAQTVFYREWYEQLCRATGRAQESPPNEAADFFADRIRQILETSEQKLIIVVDGIDEALGQEFDASALPTKHRSNIKVVISARIQADSLNGANWLYALRWTGQHVSPTMELGLLGDDAFSNAVDSIGFPDDSKSEIKSLLISLTEREPLLLELYIDDLKRSVLEGTFSIAAMRELKPGYKALFQNAFEEQKRAWKSEKANINDEAVAAVFAILSVAHAPLSRESITKLFQLVSGRDIIFSHETLIAPLRRFIIGEGTEASGYVLAHPKLSTFLREDYVTPQALRRTQQAFVLWLDSVLSGVETGSIDPSKVPQYLLTNAVPHLRDVNASEKDFMRLLSPKWERGWEAFENSNSGYYICLRSALSHVVKTRQSHIDIDSSVCKIRLALAASSLISLGKSIPPDLLEYSLREGLTNWRHAQHVISLQPQENRIGYWLQCHARMYEGEIEEFLQSVRVTKDPSNRVQHATSGMTFFPSIADALFEVATASLPLIENLFQKARSEILIAERSSGSEWKAFIDEAKNALPNIENVEQQLSLLHLLWKFFSSRDEAQQKKISAEAGTILLSGSFVFLNRANTFLQIHECLPADARSTALNLFCDIAERGLVEAIDNDSRNPNLYLMGQTGHAATILVRLLLLANKLGLRSEDILSRVNSVVKVMQPQHELDAFYQQITQDAEGELRNQLFALAFAHAKTMPAGNNILHSMARLYPLAPDCDKREVAVIGFENTHIIDDRYSHAITMVALYKELSAASRPIFGARVGAAISRVNVFSQRVDIILTLAECSTDQEKGALQAAAVNLLLGAPSSWDVGNAQTNALRTLLPQFRRSVFDAALKQPDFSQEATLLKLAMLAENARELWSPELFDEALRLAASLPDTSFFKWKLLSSLIPVAVSLGKPSPACLVVRRALREPKSDSGVDILPDLLKRISSMSAQRLAERRVKRILTRNWSEKGVRSLLILSEYISDATKGSVRDFLKIHYDAQIASDNLPDSNLLKDIGALLEGANRESVLDTSVHVASRSNPDSAASHIAAACANYPSLMKKVSALDLIHSVAGCPRSDLLSAYRHMAPMFQAVGGDELVGKVMNALDEASARWP